MIYKHLSSGCNNAYNYILTQSRYQDIDLDIKKTADVPPKVEERKQKNASIEAFFNYSNAIFRKLFIASYPAFNILGIVFISALFNSFTSSSPLNNLPPIL